MTLRILRVSVPFLAICSHLVAQVELSKTPDAGVESASVPADGTAVFDGKSLKVLYVEAKEENEKRAESLPDHLSDQNLELVELKPLLVEAKMIELPPNLKRLLDPANLDALWERLDRIDPVEANIVRWQSRTDAEFMLGTHDNTGILGRHEGSLSKGITVKQFARLFGLDKDEEERQLPPALQR